MHLRDVFDRIIYVFTGEFDRIIIDSNGKSDMIEVEKDSGLELP